MAVSVSQRCDGGSSCGISKESAAVKKDFPDMSGGFHLQDLRGSYFVSHRETEMGFKKARTGHLSRGRCRRRAHPFREDPRSLFDRDAPSRPGMPARRCFGHAIAARLRPSSVRLYLPLPSRRTSPSRAILASLRMTVGRGMPMYWASLYAVIGLPSASPIATPTSSSTSPARDANRRSLSSAMDRARMSSTVRRKRVPTVPSVLTFPLVSYIYPRSL